MESSQQLRGQMQRIRQKFTRAAFKDGRQQRLYTLLKAETATWHRKVDPKRRELPTPVMSNDGRVLVSREERLEATADLHK